MCCTAPSYVASPYYTRLCTQCGVETYIGFSPQPIYNVAPLPKGYSRTDRFRVLVKKILGTHQGPPASDDVWVFLTDNKPYGSLQHIVASLKKSKLRIKHYQCAHIFYNIFVPIPEHRPFSSKQLSSYENTLCKLFDNALYKWNSCFISGTRFFSYTWLLEKFLLAIDLTFYLKYLKRLQCPLRRKKYTDMWSAINCELQIHERPHHYVQAISRSPNESIRTKNPHNQEYRLGLFQSPAVLELVHSVRDQTYMQHALRGIVLGCGA